MKKCVLLIVMLFCWVNFAASQTVVAVLDTGIDYNHPLLQNRVLGGYNFINNSKDYYDDNGHGTHVAGIIAQHNPSVSLFAGKILNHRGFVSSTIPVIEGLEWAIQYANVVNLSVSYNTYIKEIEDALIDGQRKNVMFVVAAGNAGNDRCSYFGCFDFSNLITVGAWDVENNNRARFSQYGNWVDLYASGVSIHSSVPGGGYDNLSGTSMSTPVVSAAAAQIYEYFPGIHHSRVKCALENTADLKPDILDSSSGGLVDVDAAIDFLANNKPCIDYSEGNPILFGIRQVRRNASHVFRLSIWHEVPADYHVWASCTPYFNKRSVRVVTRGENHRIIVRRGRTNRTCYIQVFDRWKNLIQVRRRVARRK